MKERSTINVLLFGSEEKTQPIEDLFARQQKLRVTKEFDEAEVYHIVIVSDLESDDTKKLTQYLVDHPNCLAIAHHSISESSGSWLSVKDKVDDFYSSPEEISARIPFVTQRLRMRESSSQQFLAIFENAVDAIIIIDLVGVIQRINASAESIFQYSPEETLGQNVKMLMPPTYARHHDSYLSNYVATGVKKVIGIGREVEGRRKNGEIFPMELALSEFQSDGQRYFAGIVRDITDRRKLEHALLRTSDHERRRVGQDLHDGLGQMLTGISLISKNIATRLEAESHALAEEMLEVTELMRDADRMTREIARGLVPVELDGEGLFTALRTLTEKAGKIFNVSCTMEENGEVVVEDSSAALNLYRIAQECISNAVKHGKATQVMVRLEQVADEIHLSVADNGIGFPDVLPKDRGMGVDIMRHRARVVNAHLEISLREEGGTIVRCVLSSLHA